MIRANIFRFLNRPKGTQQPFTKHPIGWRRNRTLSLLSYGSNRRIGTQQPISTFPIGSPPFGKRRIKRVQQPLSKHPIIGRGRKR